MTKSGVSILLKSLLLFLHYIWNHGRGNTSSSTLMLILDFLLLHQNTQNREVPELITHKYWFMLWSHYPGNKFPFYWISLKSSCRLCNRHAHTRAIPVRNLHFINWNDYRCFLTSELFCSDVLHLTVLKKTWVMRSVHVSHQEENKEYLYISTKYLFSSHSKKWISASR